MMSANTASSSSDLRHGGGHDRDARSGTATRAVAISARGLGKTFRSRSGRSSVALEQIDLEVQDGEFLALLGPSGCGKTTLLRMIAGLEDASIGELSLFDEEVTGPTLASAMVFQGSVLLPWKSILHNVLLPARIRKLDMADWEDRAHELLEQTGLAKFANHYPRELSGGMRQRAAICRALLLDPPLLLMDEPFGALDAITRTKMNRDLLEVWRETQKTVVFVTHDIAEAARLAETVVVMSPSPGRITHRIDLGFGSMSYTERSQSNDFSDHIRNLEQLVHDVTTDQGER